MRVVTHDFYNVSRSDEFRLYPMPDPHVGAGACNEPLLRRWVKRVQDDPAGYWIFMGDGCDFINRSDPRFDPGSLAKWLKISDLIDLPAAQLGRFIDIIKPIAPKNLAMVKGNHEDAINRHYERDVFSDMVTAVKQAAGWDAEKKVTIGYNGWLILNFYRSDKKAGATKIVINLHHGFGGGKLAGGKALNMEKWLWTHECDLTLMGHVHIELMLPVTVQKVVGNKVVNIKRKGAFTGSFLESFVNDAPATYAEKKGYFPLSTGWVEVKLRPGAEHYSDRVKIEI